MHPVITQAIAAEQIKERQADAAAARRARQFRRSWHARPFLRFPRVGRGPVPRPAPRPLRGPRAA